MLVFAMAGPGAVSAQTCPEKNVNYWQPFPPGGESDISARHQALVLKRGQLRLSIQADDGLYTQDLQGTPTAWDSYAIPADHWRSLHNLGDQEALVLLLTSGDEKKSIEWASEVVQAAADRGWAMDANGCVAPKHFVDRAQR